MMKSRWHSIQISFYTPGQLHSLPLVRNEIILIIERIAPSPARRLVQLLNSLFLRLTGLILKVNWLNELGGPEIMKV